jgi:hypothetical protein
LEAKKLGLRGTKRYQFIKEKCKITPTADDRRVRKLIEAIVAD